jgi:hypothetical protein
VAAIAAYFAKITQYNATCLVYPFGKGAATFHSSRLVLGANLNIPILSVTVYTLALNVIFVANLGEIFPDQPVILPSQVLLPTRFDDILNKAAVNQFHSQIIPSRVFCFASKLSSSNATPREKQEGKGIKVK